MKIGIHISDLEAPLKSAGKKYERTSSVSLARRSVGLSIDLHGQAVDDAEILLDKYLDDAFFIRAGRSNRDTRTRYGSF